MDEPEAMPPARVGRRHATAGQRVGDRAIVVDLADDLVLVVPDGQGAVGPGVTQRVSGHLADSEHEVVGASIGKARGPGVLQHLGPDP